MFNGLQVVLAFVAIILMLIFARKFRVSKMIKTRDFILEDLKSKGAVTPETAVKLAYAHKSILKMGVRDDKPKILKQLIQFSIVGITDKDLFYLNEAEIAAQTIDQREGGQS